jgi:putative peptidoglycan lipid II flippase
LFLVLPCVLGLALLAQPIVALLYERRSFDALDTAKTALALRAYGYGLLFYSWLKVLQPAFYAIERRWWPLVASLLALGLNIGCNWWFVFVLKLGHESLAMTTSITAAVNFLLLYAVMRGFTRGMETGHLLGLFARLVLPCAVMAAVCLAADRWIFASPGWTGLAWRAASLTGVVAAAAAVYFALARLLRVPEAAESLDLILRRFGRTR